MSRLVKMWHQVTWFWSNYKWWLKEEYIDWIRIIRKFSVYTIYFFAWTWYLRFLRKEKVDIIIDEAWWIPLLSPIFIFKIPIIFFIHHIWEKEWDEKLYFPFNKIFKYLFSVLLKIYSNKTAITVSDSSANNLLEYWFKRDNIEVIENVVELDPVSKIDFESKENWIVYVWRIAPIKRIEDAIISFYEIQPWFPDYVLKIVWRKQWDEYANKLFELIKKLNIENKVEFIFDASDELRNEIVSKSKACLIPSMKEWFWIIVLEANAMWTTVIWYNVPWLKDSIKDWVNWHLVSDWDQKAMSYKLLELLENNENYRDLTNRSLQHFKTLPWWDEQTNRLLDIINWVINKK